VQISVSICVTGVDSHHKSDCSLRVQSLVRTADRRMYGDKRSAAQDAETEDPGGFESFESLPGCKNEIT
jgi:hypothetical protein